VDFGPHFFVASLEGAITAAVLALTAVGLSIVFGIMRVVNVAHGEFYMLGAVLAWWITSLIAGHPALGFSVALIVAPLLVGSLAVICDQLVLRRINYDPERTIVATIGGESGFALTWPWGMSTTTYKLAVIVAAIVILLILYLIMTRTKIGLIMRATQLDQEMAQAHGIAVNKVYALVFGLGAALAALGAVLVVPIQQAHYLMGGDPLLLSFIVVIIGGLGSVPGTVVAAVLIGMSDGIISVFFTPTLAKILATLLVAFVLIFKPDGLFGKRRE